MRPLVVNGKLVETFSSPRVFRIWDITSGHGLFLVRSERDYQDPESENIDLVFVATDYIELPNTLSGIEITTANSADIEYLRGRESGYRSFSADNYFVLVSQEKRYYITAAYLAIGYNKLRPTQTPIRAPAGGYKDQEGATS